MFLSPNGKCNINSRKIISLAALINCICSPGIIACPHCGFITNRNTFAASTLFLGMIYILCFYGLKIFMSESKLGTFKSRKYSLGIAFICGIIFYCWLTFYSKDVYEFERTLRSLLRFRLLRESYEPIIVVGITLSALLFRVYISKSRVEHFIYNVVGFALPMFWLSTLIRYIPPITWDVRVIIKILWIMIALLSVNAIMFRIACRILGVSMLAFCVISGCIDTLSFSVISFTSAVTLFLIADLYYRKYKNNLIVTPQNERFARFAWWTREWNHSAIVVGNKCEILEKLLNYYKTSSRSFNLIHRDSNSFTFSRGWKWVSYLGSGSEKWFYHTAVVSIDNKQDGSVQVCWDFDIKSFASLNIGKNTIIEECKKLAKAN